MKYFLFIALNSICLTTAFPFQVKSFSWKSFKPYQHTLNKNQIKERLLNLEKHDLLSDYYRVEKNRFILFSTPCVQNLHKTCEKNIEFIFHFGNRKRPTKKKFQISKNLKGLRIALDPGHFGGGLSHIEDRFIDMENAPGLSKGLYKSIKFDEGTLNLVTALLLKEKLEKKGASVFLTRNQIGKGTKNFGKNQWNRWLKDGSFEKAVEQSVLSLPISNANEVRKWWLKSSSESQRFRFFINNRDKENRARLINEFNPHATLSIHYNAEGSRNPKTQKNKGTSENYSLVFIGGAFERTTKVDELSKEINRYDFIRLLLTDDFYESKKLAQLCIEEIERKTKVRPVRTSDTASKTYLKTHAIKLSEGVFARNLSILKQVNGPVIYPEPLLQNNFKESVALKSRDIKIQGLYAPKRILTVVEAYFSALQRYFSNASR